MPGRGKLAITFAVVPNPAEKPGELVKQVKDLGYLPFEIDVADIPTIRGDTADQLNSAIDNARSRARQK